jgi:hypothetical protein
MSLSQRTPLAVLLTGLLASALAVFGLTGCDQISDQAQLDIPIPLEENNQIPTAPDVNFGFGADVTVTESVPNVFNVANVALGDVTFSQPDSLSGRGGTNGTATIALFVEGAPILVSSVDVQNGTVTGVTSENVVDLSEDIYNSTAYDEVVYSKIAGDNNVNLPLTPPGELTAETINDRVEAALGGSGAFNVGVATVNNTSLDDEMNLAGILTIGELVIQVNPLE